MRQRLGRLTHQPLASLSRWHAGSVRDYRRRQRLASSSAVSRRHDTLRRLDRIRLVAIVDALLLVVLVVAALRDAEGLVSVLGPIHGVGFLILLFLCVQGAGEGRWGWWFPAFVVVTLGPPGSLIGEVRIRRRLKASDARPVP